MLKVFDMYDPQEKVGKVVLAETFEEAYSKFFKDEDCNYPEFDPEDVQLDMEVVNEDVMKNTKLKLTSSNQREIVLDEENGDSEVHTLYELVKGKEKPQVVLSQKLN